MKRITPAALLLLCLAACGPPAARPGGKQVIVLGVDGMNPNFLERHWDALPNLSRLRDTTPPQSPVVSSAVTS